MKIARNRIMYFGSWTAQPVEEAAAATVKGIGVHSAEVTAKTFGTAVSGLSGVYLFKHKGGSWTLNGVAVKLDTYGITGGDESAQDGDIITVTYTAKSTGWEAIGKDNDDLSKELNPDTETGKNVLGETTFNHSGYEPEVNVDLYYMDPARVMYPHLRDIAMQEKYSEEDCVGWFAEAFYESADEEAQTMEGYCYVRRAWFVPESDGGDTAGAAVPYTIHPIGAMTRKHIVYDMKTNEATITDEAA